MRTIKGIDVSTLQGRITWPLVAADGIEFAMIKATQGRGEGVLTRHLKRFTDGKFVTNIKGAADAGIKCGVYHYLTAQSIAEAKAEAAYFCAAIEPYRSRIKLWAAVDVESEMYVGKLGRYELAKIIRAFMAVLEDHGLKPMLYTNPNYLTYKLPEHEFEDVPIWLAHWGVAKPLTVPNTMIWQYGLTTVKGISGNVDANTGYFDTALLPTYKNGDKYLIKKGDIYTNGRAVPSRLVGKEFTVMQVREDRILLGEISSWVKI